MTKQISLLLISIFIFQSVVSQTKTYFDEHWEETTKEKAQYYRVTKKKCSLFHVKDYYINNILQMEGFFTDLKKEKFKGLVIFYDEKGRIKISENYNAKGQLHGLSKFYLKNGKVDYTTEFKNGQAYDGIYKPSTTEYHYKKGLLFMINENPKDGPSKYAFFERRVFGKELDTVYWTDFNGKFMGKGTYKHKKHEIINGIHASRINLRAFYTNYKNGKREGLQKMYFGTKLISVDTFFNDELIFCKSVHPLTHEKMHCDFKGGLPFKGRVFEYDFVNSNIDECKEFTYKNGKATLVNIYRGKDGVYQIYKP